ncbi:YggS family pyridoxal phosphate-dependent enzyme [Chitinibacter fontanus]|uniref:Pyridoxal phosphate homeostasis protein n=1 Tax=Chitinibacter fontanus TaxID=1737446 RepID=A0A7D5ZDW5_9NEIS|nr:YggS family pyridoxal phosphate-dependent enzyme [Chitinibacter fontanus]QLI82225.1 YggS family pyridoxal phosphate-dependent enzyme [Chitinibacter fontanus]
MATLFEAWQGVQGRIDAACTACARNPAEISLLAVSKTFPASAVRELYMLGQRHFGENYAQELSQKYAELADCTELHWHFIGPLQSNKTKQVAECADWVHAIDRSKIAERLNQQRPEHLPLLNVCLQVNVSGEESKSGVSPAQLFELAAAVTQLPRLKLRGLMCIPEATDDEVKLAKQFQLLKQCQAKLIQAGFTMDTLSMGMSADLELAIANGSTLVRVGSAIFGARHYSQQEKQ